LLHALVALHPERSRNGVRTTVRAPVLNFPRYCKHEPEAAIALVGGRAQLGRMLGTLIGAHQKSAITFHSSGRSWWAQDCPAAPAG